jgi:hypothetical protein
MNKIENIDQQNSLQYIEQLNSSQIQEGQACVKEETNLRDKIVYRCIIRDSIPPLALNLDHKIKFEEKKNEKKNS